MISVLVNWAYVFVITYIIGRFILKRAYGFFRYDKEVKTVSAVACGLAVTTMYAGYFSVFYKVGIVANVIMMAFCALFVVLDKDDYKELIKGGIIPKNVHVIKWIILACTFIVVLFFTTEGQFFSDSGYYHEQSIRWIEEFGTVKGSVHILKRLAYNSLYFGQCALFSMRELWGQSLHCLSGFYAILVLAYVTLGFNNKIRTNLIRLVPFVYFTLWCSEITSPASDFPLWFSVFFVVIRWLELLDDEEESYVPYALLSIFTVFLISIKLTVGCLALITIKPAITMIKEKKIKEIIVSLISGILFIIPYFIRNYIICGWLIYPFTALDIFNPDWKLPMEHVQSDADEIKIWGRGMGQIGGSVDDSIRTWLPHWWSYMSEPNRRFIVSFVIAVGLFLCYKLVTTIINRKELKFNIGLIVLQVAIAFSLVYWFIESPLFRYGIGYILLTAFFMLGDILEGMFKKGVIIKALAVIICVGCLLPSMRSLKEYIDWNIECVRYMSDFTHWVKQEDYPLVEYGTTEIGGITFYFPAEELGETGYHNFPSLWFSGTKNIENRGNSIKDGYRYKE